MKDEDKKKEQLIAELAELRQRITELETSKIEHKQMMDTLKESETELSTILNSVKDGIVLVDKTGKIIKINKRITEVGGYTEKDVVGKRFSALKFFTSKSLSTMAAVFAKAMAGAETYPFEGELKTKEGKKLCIEIQSSPVKKNGKIIGGIAVLRNITERKQVEEELKAKSQFLERLIQQSPLPTFVLDSKGFTVMVNEAFLKFFAVPKKEMILGKNALKEPTNIQYGVVKYIKQALKGKTVETPEIEFISPYKSKRTITKSRLFPVFDTNSKITNVVVIHEDIIERKSAEKSLKKSEERYRLISENTSDLITITTFALKPTYTYVSPSCKAFGYKPEDLIGKSAFDFIHPDDKKNLLPLLKKYFSAKTKKFLTGKGLDVSETIHLRARDKWGKWHYFESTANLLENEVLLISKDITERKQAEEVLQREKEFYRSFIESLSDWVWEMDVNGVHTYSNSAVENILGYKVSEVVGYHITELWLDDAKTPEALKRLQKTLAAGKGWENVPGKFKHKNGSAITTESTATPIFNSKNKLIGYRGLDRDITKRKRMEETLRESEARLRVIFKGAKDAIFTKDLEGYYTHVNPACSSLFGFTTDEMIGKTDFDLFPPEFARHIEEIDRAVLEKGETVSLEDTKPTAGIMRTFDVIKVPLRDETGQVIGLCGVARDITERKRAEEVLRESEEKYKFLVDNSKEIILILNKRGNIIFINRNALESFGYSEEETTGKSIAHFITKDFLKKALYALAQEFLGHPQPEMKIQVKTKSGEIRYLEVARGSTPIRKKDKLIGILISAYDITEHKRAEEALRKAEQDWRNLFNSLEDVMLIIDKDYNIEQINKIGLKFLGKSKEEIIGKKCYQIISGADSPTEECPCIKSLKTKKVESIDRYEEKFGRYFSIKTSPIFDKNGEIAKFVDIRRDITERKRVEEQIKASLKDKETLLREIHHRVKNNLQVISSLLNLQSKYYTDEQTLDIFKESQGRVKSIALIHERLYQSKDLMRVSFAEYIKTLTAYLFHSYGINRDAIALKINTNNVSLGVDMAIPCGLIINELVSKSLGLQLINILTDQLGGAIELDRDSGTKFIIRFTELKHKVRKVRQ